MNAKEFDDITQIFPFNHPNQILNNSIQTDIYYKKSHLITNNILIHKFT